jgi:type VI secretion system protein ImpA
MRDYRNLANVISADAPCGDDLRKSDDGMLLYKRMRDARSTARAEDRTKENPAAVGRQDGVVREEEIAQPSERWRDLHDLCFETLETRTKDIELFAWLTEAQVRLTGLGGLAATLDALAHFCESHFDSLHSMEADSLAEKAEPIMGLNGAHNFEGTLVRPLRLATLLPDQVYGKFCLWVFDRANRDLGGPEWAMWREQLENLDGADFFAKRDAAAACLQALDRLDAAVTDKWGRDAPSLSKIRTVLEEINAAYPTLASHAGLSIAPKSPSADPRPAPSVAPAAPTAPTAPSRGYEIASREQALELLLQVAAYFRRTEPHSSIPHALDTIVHRGRMDFLRLLEELIPQDDLRREVLTRAGIRPQTSPERNRH